MAARRLVIRQFGQGGVGAEIGVFKGEFSEEILVEAKPAKLILIDPWENMDDPDLAGAWYGAGSPHDMDAIYAGVEARFASQVAAGTVELRRMSSNAALSGLADESLDFVYVDGDHRYEAVRDDLELSLAKLKPGGILAGDDYLDGGWWKGDVIRAVNEFIGRHASEIQIALVLRGQFVFRKTG